jgi:hypothetical protein
MCAHFFELHSVSLQQYGEAAIVFQVTDRIHHGFDITGFVWERIVDDLTFACLLSLLPNKRTALGWLHFHAAS